LALFLEVSGNGLRVFGESDPALKRSQPSDIKLLRVTLSFGPEDVSKVQVWHVGSDLP